MNKILMIFGCTILLMSTSCYTKTQEEITKEISNSLKIEDTIQMVHSECDTTCKEINTCKDGKRK
jgi:hypothetical protein